MIDLKDIAEAARDIIKARAYFVDEFVEVQSGQSKPQSEAALNARGVSIEVCQPGAAKKFEQQQQSTEAEVFLLVLLKVNAAANEADTGAGKVEAEIVQNIIQALVNDYPDDPADGDDASDRFSFEEFELITQDEGLSTYALMFSKLTCF